MKVAIWGSYAYGNYGDELMALHYARHLQNLGAEPVVYRLHEPLSKKYGVASAETADALIDGADFCVFGGGSLLSGHKPSTGWYAEQKEREYEALTEAIEKYECPLYFLSIGGDGDFGDGTGIAPYRQRLLSSEMCRRATIRQEPDVALIENRFGIPATFYPDVLLNVKEFWGIDKPKSDDGKLHVGLNLPTSFAGAARLLDVCQRFKKNVVYHFIRTVRPDPARKDFGGELMLDSSGEHIQHHVYDDPIDTLRFLAGLDIIFSFKLHIGLTAAALGIPFVCVKKKLKSKAFLHSIDADFAYWGDLSDLKAKAKMLRTSLSPERVMALARQFDDQTTLGEQAALSWGHLDALESVVHEYA